MKCAQTQARQGGFTVIEAAISTALLAVIGLSIGMLSDTAMNVVQEETRRLELEQIGQTTTAVLENEILIAKPVGLVLSGTGAPSFSYVIPVDVGEDTNDNQTLDAGEDVNGNLALDLVDGDFEDPDGNIQWGVVETTGSRLDLPGFPRNIRLSLIASGTISEATVGEDINDDGDMTDAFRTGSLRYETTGGRVVDYGRGAIMFDEGDPMADLDSDGIPDPLFTVHGEPFSDDDGNGVHSEGEPFTDTDLSGAWDGRVVLNLWIARVDNDNNVYVRNFVSSMRLQSID